MKLPDPNEQNEDRAVRAQTILEQYTKLAGLDPEDAVTGLLADLAHWCDHNDTDFESELRKAASHYADETDGRGAQLDDISTPPL
jgi:hypothetical protein